MDQESIPNPLLVELVRKQRAGAGADADAILRGLLARNSGGENALGGVIESLLARPRAALHDAARAILCPAPS